MQGLPKASSIGEVSMNFADYVEATKPSSVALPIRISHCDAVLHVSICSLSDYFCFLKKTKLWSRCEVT